MEKLEDYIVRLEKVVTRFESLPTSATAGSAVSSAPTASSPSAEFNIIVDEDVAKVVQKANVIGSEGTILPAEYREEIVTMSVLFQKSFEEEKVIISAMEQCKKPHPEELQKLMEPLGKTLGEAGARSEGKRKDSFNHQKTISEFMQALIFVINTADAGKPAFHIDQSWQSAEFYANKIRKDFRSKDPKHIEWIDALQNVYKKLRAYVAKYHIKEPVWNKDGISVSEFLGTDPPTTAPPEEKPKPLPPPPQPLKAATYWQPDQKKVVPDGEAFNTMKKGLKKVDGSPSDTSKSSSTSKPEFLGAKLKPVTPKAKEGKIELEMDRKWNVEFFKGNKDIVISETNPRQSVYVFQCQDSVIKVEGKVNAITLDGCKKTALVFEDVVSLVEIINCSRTDIQCTSRVATIVADKSDECKIFIPENLMDIELTTAKSSSINLTVIKSNSEEDPEEFPVPYQFMSKFKDGKLVTEPVQHAGSA